jgi:hypothetical protein
LSQHLCYPILLLFSSFFLPFFFVSIEIAVRLRERERERERSRDLREERERKTVNFVQTEQQGRSDWNQNTVVLSFSLLFLLLLLWNFLGVF